MEKLNLIDYICATYGVSYKNLHAFDENFCNLLFDTLKIDKLDSTNLYKEAANGGYIFIPDSGAMYNSLVSNKENELVSRDGWSSHHSLDPQFSHYSSLLGEALFGTTEIDGVKGTWFQLESHSTAITQIPGHLVAYLHHVVTGKNIGPYGSSEYTEKNPLIINLDQIAVEDTDISFEEYERFSKLVANDHNNFDVLKTADILSTHNEQSTDVLLDNIQIIQAVDSTNSTTFVNLQPQSIVYLEEPITVFE